MASLVHERADILYASDGFFVSRRVQIAILAARDRIPAIYGECDHVVAGGLINYGADITDSFRQVGVYAGKILKGARPANVPVVQSTRFELVINLATARALSLDVPETLIATTDELIK